LALQWRRGARSGGARPFAGSIRAFKPERSETYELSLRRDPAPEVQARMAVFYNDWRDRQVQLLEPGQSSFTIENAGAAHAYGAEAQIQFALAEHWQAGFSMGWLQTQFDRFPIASASDVVDLAGNRFTRAPRRTALLHALYAPTRGLQAGAQWRYADQVEGDAFNRASTRLPSFHTVDLRVGWQAANWNLALNLENALDRRYLQQVEASLISPDPRAFVLAPRRNIALELGFRW
jgi:iron complex outermembrane receptor protein